MDKTRKVIILCLSILLVCGICYGDDWPQFRGPNRDGKSTETGLLKKWPEGGPKQLSGNRFFFCSYSEGIRIYDWND